MDLTTNIAEQVYCSLLGQLVPACSLDWVDNIFTEGSVYGCRYAVALDAYARICQRLGTGEEDHDVEVIINALLDNEHTVALKMFEYGMRYGRQKP